MAEGRLWGQARAKLNDVCEVPAQPLAECPTTGTCDLSPLLGPLRFSEHNGPFPAGVQMHCESCLSQEGRSRAQKEARVGVQVVHGGKADWLAGVPVGLRDSLHADGWDMPRTLSSLGLPDTQYGNYMASPKSRRTTKNKTFTLPGWKHRDCLSWFEGMGRIMR